MEIFKDWNRVHVHEADEAFAMVYFGVNKFCKTEADALEAAELLKTFFEAKAAGKVARLFVEDKALSPMGTAIGPNPHHEPQRPKNTVIDQMNDEPPNVYERIRDRVHVKAERHARQQIAHMATEIFAHGGYTSHAAAVDDAAEIWRLSQQVEL